MFNAYIRYFTYSHISYCLDKITKQNKTNKTCHFLGLSKMLRNFPLVISRAVTQENTTTHTRLEDLFSVHCYVHYFSLHLSDNHWQVCKKWERKSLPALPQHWPADLLFRNAKHVFNICTVTQGGNLYKHLFIQDMENNIKWRRGYQRALWFAWLLSQCSGYKYSDLRVHESVCTWVCAIHQDDRE